MLHSWLSGWLRAVCSASEVASVVAVVSSITLTYYWKVLQGFQFDKMNRRVVVEGQLGLYFNKTLTFIDASKRAHVKDR